MTIKCPDCGHEFQEDPMEFYQHCPECEFEWAPDEDEEGESE